MKPWKLIAVVALVGVLTGCSGDVIVDRTPGVGDSLSPSGSVTSPGKQGSVSINGPLQDAFSGGADFVTGEVAKHYRFEVSLESCMKSQGFSYKAAKADIKAITETGLEMAYRTFLADDYRRNSLGYGVTGYLVGKVNSEESGGELPDNSKSSKETAAYGKALDVCGSKAAYEALPGNLGDQVWEESRGVAARIENDVEVVDAEKAWFKCMGESGFVFSHFGEPELYLEKKSSGVIKDSAAAKRLHKEELQMAKVDWDCRVEYVNDVYLRVRDREEIAFIEENQELVNQLRDAMKEIVFG